jgi:hypothetical protein
MQRGFNMNPEEFIFNHFVVERGEKIITTTLHVVLFILNPFG